MTPVKVGADFCHCTWWAPWTSAGGTIPPYRFDFKQEEDILNEGTALVRKIACDLDLLEVRRVDIKDGKVTVLGKTWYF